MNPEPQTQIQYDADSLKCLQTAAGVAGFTDFQCIHPGHLLMALCTDFPGYLDGFLQKLFRGLRAATIEASLQDILQTVPCETKNSECSPEQCTFGGKPASTELTSALKQAAGLAEKWGLSQINVQAISCALFRPPDSFIQGAFSDAGIGEAAIHALADNLEQAFVKKHSGPATGVDTDSTGNVMLERFGPVARAALLTMAGLTEDRSLLELDFLFALSQQPTSRFLEAVQIAGADAQRVSRDLAMGAGKIRGKKDVLEKKRVGAVLTSVFDKAAAMATAETCSLISESHLLRAHMDRVSQRPGNIYERLEINSAALYRFFEKYPTDRAPAAAQPATQIVQDIEAYLRSRVINQEQAVTSVLPALKRMRAGLNEPGRLMGVFLFLGPTGVGKTEMARAIADVAFGPKPGARDPYLININCAKLTEKRDIVQLLGAPQGLVGYKEGALTNGLRDKPRSVVLFDEAEKSAPQIWQGLLQFFDEGIVTEADGTEYDATGCILVATSNLGYKEALERFNFFNLTPEQMHDIQPQVENYVWSFVETYFSPEFRGRFGRENVIFFNHFSQQDYEAIVRMQASALTRELAVHGLEVTFDSKVIEGLAQLALEARREGARSVRRLVTRFLRDQIVDVRAANPSRTRIQFLWNEKESRPEIQS